MADATVRETDVTEYDGTHTLHRFNPHHYTDIEIYDATGPNPILVSVERDPQGQFVTGLTERCTIHGRRVTRTVPVTRASEELVKAALVGGTCSPRGSRS